jgi:hypothetical protein
MAASAVPASTFNVRIRGSSLRRVRSRSRSVDERDASREV